MNKRQISSTSYQGGGMVNKIIGIAKNTSTFKRY
jgi:hypothetical protein